MDSIKARFSAFSDTIQKPSYGYNLFLDWVIFISKPPMDDITNQIALLRTQMNLELDPTKKQELNKKLNVLNLKKEIETIKKRIQQLSN